MTNSIEFPNSIYEFLLENSFKDTDEFYTNGSLLIPTFRVKQAIEHYYESCEDAISRQTLKQKLQEHHDFFVNAYGSFKDMPYDLKVRVDEITNCIAEVVNAPSVKPKYTDEEIDKAQAVEQAYVDKMVELAVEEVKRPKGKWIKIQSGDEDFPESIVCSRCKGENSHIDFNEHGEPIGKIFVMSKYCPNCGAYMSGGEEDEDSD